MNFTIAMLLGSDTIAKQLFHKALLINLAHRIARHRFNDAENGWQLVCRQTITRPSPQLFEIE